MYTAGGGPYEGGSTGPQFDLVTVFEDEVKDGLFLFKITDSYGDGLCCQQEEGYYDIIFESYQDITSKFEQKSEEDQEFGDDSKKFSECPVRHLVFCHLLCVCIPNDGMDSCHIS